MRQFAKGFLHGMTFYPFPCIVLDPYAGWTLWTFRGYLAGVISVPAFAGALFLLLI